MTIDYQSLIDEAMLDIVRKILIYTKDKGLESEQSFYISFRTDYPGVILSNNVKKRFPEEITIVLQYQYKDLNIFKDSFSVNIMFSAVPEIIEVPFKSITSFIDPMANFNLQFKNHEDMKVDSSESLKTDGEIKNFTPLSQKSVSSKSKNINSPLDKKAGEVIAIDKFRKKN